MGGSWEYMVKVEALSVRKVSQLSQVQVDRKKGEHEV